MKLKKVKPHKQRDYNIKRLITKPPKKGPHKDRKKEANKLKCRNKELENE